MLTKKFQSYLEKRLTKTEIKDIERQAKLEVQALKALQKDIAKAMAEYLKKEKIGFNELVRRLDASPTHVAKIQRGEANLTLASLVRIFAILEKTPHLVFSEK
jgi:transcriptional regulator with XRE-family HTH domain